MGAMPTSQEYLSWESGTMTPEQETDFFQRLIDSDLLETLSARYGRRADELLLAGLIFA